MNTLLESRFSQAETVDFRRNDTGSVRKANGSPPNQGRSELGWLKATVPTIDPQRDDFELTH